MNVSPNLKRKQRGLALISIMVMVTLMTILLSGIFYRHQLDIVRAIRVISGEQAMLLALSTESWALNVFVEDDKKVDHLNEDWARQIPVLPIEGGTVTGKIIDLQGRFNLNNFIYYASAKTWQKESEDISGTSLIATYTRLLESLELDADLAKAAVIVDWIDSNSGLISSDGAEDDEYYRLGKAYVAANAMMVEPEELALLSGYQINDVMTLADSISALPAQTLLNINTADRRLLMALHQDIDEAVADEIIDQRPFEDLDEFYATVDGLLNSTVSAKVLLSALVDIKSRYYVMQADVRLGDIRIQLDSHIERNDDGQAAVLFRRMQFVPLLAQTIDPSDAVEIN
jgi:general secretion pathway protein K|tara:strand:- start:898 stop:1929 length:1032 start_codon:yes stop_codon:yes gene_type:complete